MDIVKTEVKNNVIKNVIGSGVNLDVIEDGITFISQEGKPCVSSKEVADHFGKQHKHVMESIKNIKAENSAMIENMFFKDNYKSGTGKNYPMYLMNRDGFTLLAMGFTGKKALEWKLKYIEAFNKMEQQLNSPELQMARAVLTANELIERKQQQIVLLEEKNKDQVKLLALAMGNNDRYIVRDIAKFYGMNSRQFNILLNKLKIQKKFNKRWVLTKKYENKPYMVSTCKKRYNENHEVIEKVYFNAWTNEGLKFLYEILKKNGYEPAVEN